MTAAPTIVFATERLLVHLATVADAALFAALWQDPAVMTYVGFPHGLGMSHDEIVDQLQQQGDSPFYHLLVVALKTTGEPIGECFMSPPNQAGIAETDVKLLPAFWGNKYGVEVKRGLLQYLFAHTDCTAVQATPNIHNIASIKMQEAVGAVKAGTSKSLIPQPDGSPSIMVEFYIYRVYKRIWQKAQRSQNDDG